MQNVRRISLSLATTAMALVLASTAAGAQSLGEGRPQGMGSFQVQKPTSGQGTIFVPDSSQPKANDAGTSVHTHVRAFLPEQAVNPKSVSAGGYFFETPASLACIYGQVTTTPCCVPGSASKVSTGGSKTIAIVDAYDDPNVASDLATYSAQYGLPTAKFSVTYATGTKPAQDSTGGWALETALDVEAAHALAPNATIVLVEAASANVADLLKAVDVASALVAKAGGGEVSMSWGSSEFSGESTYDSHFSTANVVYVAAAGDAPGVEWPAASANVVGVGGTTVSRNPTTGVLISEASWADGGGGPSAFNALPSFQSAVSSLTGAKRATPDLAAAADPNTPVMVYDSFPLSGSKPGWTGVGGTSAATPLVAAMINAAGKFRASSAAELAAIYSKAGTAASLNAITRGLCGPYGGYAPGGLWNPCVGVGSPAGQSAL